MTELLYGFDMPESKEIHFAEHEVFLSFNEDSQAEDFMTWFNIHGLRLFVEWLYDTKETEE